MWTVYAHAKSLSEIKQEVVAILAHNGGQAQAFAYHKGIKVVQYAHQTEAKSGFSLLCLCLDQNVSQFKTECTRAAMLERSKSGQYGFTQNYNEGMCVCIPGGGKAALKRFGGHWNALWKNDWPKQAAAEPTGVWKLIPKSWGENALTPKLISMLK